VIDPNRSLPEVLAEMDGGGNIQRNYVYGYGLVEQITSSNSVSYYHFDSTGNTLALTSGAGAMTDSYAYTPYGETTVNGNTVNPFRYVGKYGVMDDGNGLQFMRARFYRPDVARFMSLDPLPGDVKDSQTLNRYAYAKGNPILFSDADGREAVSSLEIGKCYKEPPRFCPLTPPIGDDRFTNYVGDSRYFHCGYEGYLSKEKSVDKKFVECFYDKDKNLITETSPYAACRGTNDSFRADEDPFLHTVFDEGGINSDYTVPALKASFDKDPGFFIGKAIDTGIKIYKWKKKFPF
jgi:RHS repeat-associated protein